MTWDRERMRALDAVVLLERLLRDSTASDARVTEGYLDAKRALAGAFQARALDTYGDSTVLARTVELVEGGIRESFPGLPAPYARVQGYGAVHSALLAYLTDRVGRNVPADELRILTRDAVHTERRARDLRDLGFTLGVGTAAGMQVYCLADEVPDVAEGARLNVAKNIRNDRRVTKERRHQLLLQFGLPVDED